MQFDRELIRMAMDSSYVAKQGELLEVVLRDAVSQKDDGSDGENTPVQMPYIYFHTAVAAASIIGCRIGLRFYGPAFVVGCMVGGALTILFSRLS